MSWPTPQEYNEAIQNPSLCFADDDLRRGTVSLNKLGLPAASTGTFASVYKVSCNGSDWAVRCFLNQRDEQEERYQRISESVLMDDIDSTVPFHYLKQGMLVKGQWYPILKMNWVNGETLDVYLRKNFRDILKMKALIDDFSKAANDLDAAGIAHGDLQHGNILVTDLGLRLVDYDALYVPALKGMKSLELGHPNFQHPKRSERFYDTGVDNFSCWLIKFSLEAIAIDPDLYERFGNGEEWLLLRRADLCAPEQSPLFTQLLEHSSESIKQNAKILRRMLWESPEKIPELNATSDELSLLPSEPPEQSELPEPVDDGAEYNTPQEVPFLRGGFIDSQPNDKLAKNAPLLSRVGKAIGSGTEQFFRNNDATTWASYKFNRADLEFRKGKYDLALPHYLELYTVLDARTPRNAFVSCEDGLGKAIIRSAYCYGFLGQNNLAHNCFLAGYNRISSKGRVAERYRMALLLSASHFTLGQKDAAISVLSRSPGIEKIIQSLIVDELRDPGYLRSTLLLELLCAYMEQRSQDSLKSPMAESSVKGLLLYAACMFLFERIGRKATVETERLIFRLLIDTSEEQLSAGRPVESLINQIRQTCTSICVKEGLVASIDWGIEDYIRIGDGCQERRELDEAVLQLLFFSQSITAKHLSNKDVLSDLEKLNPWVATKFITKFLPAHKLFSLKELVLNAEPSLHPRAYPFLLLTAGKHCSPEEYIEMVNRIVDEQTKD